MKKLLLLFSFIIFLGACDNQTNNTTFKFQGSTMGTQYHIVLVTRSTSPAIPEKKIKNTVTNILLEINRQMSTYISDSEISKFNQYQSNDWFPISRDFAFVVQNAQQVSKISDGAFDITTAPLIDLWGFGKKVVNTLPSETQINEQRKNIGYKQLEVRQTPPAIRKHNNMRIDLSALAKGFAVDKISIYLSNLGLINHLVEIGGEIRSSGNNNKNKLWNIAIANPNYEQQKSHQSLTLNNQALATSGNYHNYFMKKGIRYSHTINPKSGRPIKHKLASVTVLHTSAMMADAYATALMVMGDIKGKDFALKHKLRINMIAHDGDIFKSWDNF